MERVRCEYRERTKRKRFRKLNQSINQSINIEDIVQSK